MIVFIPAPKFDKEATILLLVEDSIKSYRFPFPNKLVKEKIQAVIDAGQFRGKDGELFPVLTHRSLVLLVGLGKKEKFSLTGLRIAVRKALKSSYLSRFKRVELIVHEQSTEVVKAAIEGDLIGAYAWRKYVSKDREDHTIDRKDVYLVASKTKFYDEAVLICDGVNLSRDLINENADVATSEYLEKAIRDLIKGKRNISIEVLNKRALSDKGLNLHLAVNQGSRKEPKLIIVKYQGSIRSGDFTALVGKGITFDTGGLNLKPSGSMETMRADMSGAAAVIGTLKNTIALNLKKNVIFAVGIAENVIGSGSFKPGDVIKSYSGKTVEIANTDAEGRLVLADAISYVIKNYKPARLIDIATLTGACVVALGHDYSGLVTNDDRFSREIIRASNETDDRVWRLPIYPELKDAVKSQIADIRNLGYPKGAAGTITAAEFLHQFTNGVLWAHLDIAGTAFVDGPGRLYFGYGATGAGVRLLTHVLQHS